MSGTPGPVVLHIASREAWDDAYRQGTYAADSLATEGFIHCSTPAQVIDVANRLFRGRTDLVLLQIDVSRLDAPVRAENLEGGTERYPHVYGAIPVAAIVHATPFPPRDDGTFDDGQLDDLLVAHGGIQPAGPEGVAADEAMLLDTTHAIAGAIGRRDARAIEALLAPGFAYRPGDGAAIASAEAFLEGIRNIPGEIAFVRVEHVAADVAGDAALVTGVQHARLTLDGQQVDDRRGFADFFVRIDGGWKLRAGSDFPLT